MFLFLKRSACVVLLEVELSVDKQMSSVIHSSGGMWQTLEAVMLQGACQDLIARDWYSANTEPQNS
jgi:hypothetical protein